MSLPKVRGKVQEKKEISKLSKIMLVWLTLLLVVLIVITIFERCGLRLIWANGVITIGIIGLLSMVVWGGVSLVKRIGSRSVKMIVGFLLALVMMTGGMVAMTYVSQYSQLLLESEYATFTSADGRKVVVMRRVDTGIESDEAFYEMQDRMYARYDEYLREQAENQEEPAASAAPEATAAPDATAEPASDAAQGETSAEEEIPDFPIEAYGYVYTAYPRALGFFYRPDADTEGVIYRGYSSEAKILYAWNDDGSVRIYLENPEVADSGEITVRF